MIGTNSWDEYIEGLIRDCADREATEKLRATRASGDGGTAIEALPTVYRDTQFRSLLEACWAATLDSLNIVWEYEPKTFDLPSGTKYLPDFHLPELGIWIEVKGTGVPRVEKAYELGKLLACDCPILACTCEWPGGEMVIVGHPPTPINPWADEDFRHWPHRSKVKLVRRHGGFIHWTSTRCHNSWMTACTDCGRVMWVEWARLLRCPACGASFTSRLYRDFEHRFEFVRLPWLSGSATKSDDAETDEGT